MQSINPATGDIVASYSRLSSDELTWRLEQTARAFAAWRRTTFVTRRSILQRAALLLRERQQHYAELMALEMGKPIRQGRGEVEKCAWACEHYAEHGETYLARETIATDAAASFVSFQPLGVVLAVMPWNFPFWQVLRFAAPALMAGNAAVLKHASNVSGCALAIETLLADAGLPPHVFSTLLIGSDQVASVIADSRIAAVTLTGSGPAGAAVAEAAGRALKKTVLELGGSDAYVVLADADLDAAVNACATSRLTNSGQSCIAAKRFIVVEEVRPGFERALVAMMRKAVVGDPRDPQTDVGPLARVDLRNELHDQVQRSLERGAQLLCGGVVPAEPGAWYPPTVLTAVERGMPAYDEELFGPVAAVIAARNTSDALRLANDSIFGLGGAIFTADTARGIELAERELDAGTCCVNTFVRSDPRLPFGGIKQSGYGRELSSYGIRELVNIKTVYVGG